MPVDEDRDLFAPGIARRNGFGKDKPVGYTLTGVVTEIAEVAQTDMATGKPEYWDDGKPKMQVRVLVQTDLREEKVDDDGTVTPAAEDDGIRALYARGGKAVGPKGGRTMKEAISAASVKYKLRVKPGVKLTVKFLEEGSAPKPGFDKPKLYVAKIEPGPEMADPDDLL